MFQAPPAAALVGNSAERSEKREKLRQSNFSLKDGLAAKHPITTQSQANNMLRQDQWNKGQIVKANLLAKPADSINFGQACQYTSETKSTFVGQ